MTESQRGKLTSSAPELPYRCDICDRPRSKGVHTRCSNVRQERHAQILRNEEFDRLLMFDKPE